MSFLQPLLLLGLPAALLPVLIHLLNRLRYRSVRWAAVRFLLEATRTSTRRSRLRHYLILASRVLALGCFLFALCRPLVGGWFGSLAGRGPETVFVLLDRSATMSAIDPRRQDSALARAIELVGGAGAAAARGARFVLVESVHRDPQLVADAAALGALDRARPTHAAADLPAMLRAALTYLKANQTGPSEIWIASDLQRGNWRPEAAEWAALRAELAALPARTRVRILAMGAPPTRNRSVALESYRPRLGGERPAVELRLSVRHADGPPEAFPLEVVVNGVARQRDLDPRSPEYLHEERIELEGEDRRGGWGAVRVPADYAPADNEAFFVYAAPPELRAAVVNAGGGEAESRIALAAAPPVETLRRESEPIAPAAFAGVDLSRFALVAWLAPLPGGEAAAALRAFVEGGGAVACFPPPAPEAAGTWLDLEWGPPEDAPADRPFRVPAWESREGPLAKTEEGYDVPVDALAVARRRGPAGAFEAAGYAPLASFADGKPLLLRRRLGRGQVFVLATLPDRDWSSLGEGRVLVPMLQRMLETGSTRQAPAEILACGEELDRLGDGPWVPQDGGPADRDPRYQAGVYARGAARIAVNRPAVEDDPARVPREAVEALFAGLPLLWFDAAAEAGAAAAPQEVSVTFLAWAAFFLLAEAALLLGERRAPAAAAGGGGTP